MTRALVMLDGNGTVFDDTPFFYAGIRQIFIELGVSPVITLEEYYREIEAANGDYMIIYRSRGITEEGAKLHAIYGKEYMRHMDKIALSPGVKEALCGLQKNGVALAFVSAQTQSLAKPLMARLGLLDFFRCIILERTDKAAVIASLALRHLVPLDRCFYVGDAPSDMRHARQAGVKAVAYLNGHVPEGLMMATRPDFVIRHFDELPPLVADAMQKGGA